MSEPNTILSQENVPTFVAVAMILALLALGLNYWVYRQVEVSTGISLMMDVNANNKNAEVKKEIVALTERLAALEAKAAAVPALSATAGAAAESGVPAK